MPHGAVYVGRPSKWGNPFQTAEQFRAWLERGAMLADDRRYRILRDLGDLLGKDLACWCPLGAPCHADVLLELANAPAESDADG